MSEQYQLYTESRQRLLDSLKVIDTSLDQNPALPGEFPIEPRQVHHRWAASANSAEMHMKLVSPYRADSYTFLLVHLEKGVIYHTNVPEDLIIQCLTGRFIVTDPAGKAEVISASGRVLIRAGIIYRYEALEEVYNIMKVLDNAITEILEDGLV